MKRISEIGTVCCWFCWHSGCFIQDPHSFWRLASHFFFFWNFFF